MLHYPREWAETYGMTDKRMLIGEAIQFVSALASYEFGSLIEMHNQHVEAGTNPDDDHAVQTEQSLQEDLEAVSNWLKVLRDAGQRTISPRKVRTQIEVETGYELRLT